MEENIENSENKETTKDIKLDESNEHKKKDLKKNYVFNLIYQIFVLIVPLITAPYISRILSAEGIGQYSFTNSLQSYFTLVAALGFGYYAQRLIAFNQDNKHEQSKIFWEIIIVRSFSVGFAVLLNLILYFTGVYKEYNSLMFWWTLNILAIGFDITFLLQGNEDFGKIVGRNVVIKIISVALIFILVKKQTDVWLYVILTSCASLLGNISLWLYLPKYLNKIKRSELKPLRHFWPTVKLFIPTIATSVYTILDKTLIGLLIQDTYVVKETQIVNGVETVVEVVKKYSDLENGYYEQSEKIVKMCLCVMTALGTVMIPRNSKLFMEGKTEDLKKNFYFAINYVWVLGIPMMFGLAAIASNIIPWFLGDGYDKCIQLMQIFTPLIIFIGLSNVFGLQYLIPTGRDKKFTIGILAGTISNLILNCILIPFFWSYGAIIASLVAEFLVTLTMYLLIRKEVSLKETLKTAIKPLIAGLAMFALVYFLSTKFSPSILHTLALVAIGAVTYFILLLVMKEKLVYNSLNKMKSKFFGGGIHKT